MTMTRVGPLPDSAFEVDLPVTKNIDHKYGPTFKQWRDGFEERLKKRVEKYTPGQPRDPRGEPTGGQWRDANLASEAQSKIPAANKGGDCYDTAAGACFVGKRAPGLETGAARLAEALAAAGAKQDDVRIVQAEVTGQGPLAGMRYGHSWAEYKHKVYDFSMGRSLILPDELYYNLGHVVEEKGKYASYTPRQAAEMMIKTGHYGPWELDTKV